jgi:DNA-binding response OmpR family regulator
VLIVDDNAEAADGLAALVRALGGEATTANDDEAGIRKAGAFQPDAVLLDIGLPGIDGYETCRRLRAESYGQRAYIVAVPGWGQEHDRARAKTVSTRISRSRPIHECYWRCECCGEIWNALRRHGTPSGVPSWR